MVKMRLKLTADGMTFELRRTLSGWCYPFLSDYVVYFRRPTDRRGKWQAWRSLVQESIAFDDTLQGTFLKAKKHFVGLLRDKSISSAHVS